MYKKKDIFPLYKKLLKTYGPQGWWPLLACNGVNPTKTGSCKGYHPHDYSYPHNHNQIFEICLGAILAQNVAWPNVEKALLNLKKLRAVNAKALKKLAPAVLKDAIRPAGYYNQKAEKVKHFTDFYLQLKGTVPARNELLGIWGIGKETADSMLCYAYKQPYFVVDAYTIRLFRKEGFINDTISKSLLYDTIQEIVHQTALKQYHRLADRVIFYQEFHALIVEQQKR